MPLPKCVRRWPDDVLTSAWFGLSENNAECRECRIVVTANTETIDNTAVGMMERGTACICIASAFPLQAKFNFVGMNEPRASAFFFRSNRIFVFLLVFGSFISAETKLRLGFLVFAWRNWAQLGASCSVSRICWKLINRKWNGFNPIFSFVNHISESLRCFMVQ